MFADHCHACNEFPRISLGALSGRVDTEYICLNSPWISEYNVLEEIRYMHNLNHKHN